MKLVWSYHSIWKTVLSRHCTRCPRHSQVWNLKMRRREEPPKKKQRMEEDTDRSSPEKGDTGYTLKGICETNMARVFPILATRRNMVGSGNELLFPTLIWSVLVEYVMPPVLLATNQFNLLLGQSRSRWDFPSNMKDMKDSVLSNRLKLACF